MQATDSIEEAYLQETDSSEEGDQKETSLEVQLESLERGLKPYEGQLRLVLRELSKMPEALYESFVYCLQGRWTEAKETMSDYVERTADETSRYVRNPEEMIESYRYAQALVSMLPLVSPEWGSKVAGVIGSGLEYLIREEQANLRLFRRIKKRKEKLEKLKRKQEGR